jgi:hypothetical protein
MADPVINIVAAEVAALSSVNPFARFVIYRIDRSCWQHTPETPGIYLLHGVTAGRAKALPVGGP